MARYTYEPESTEEVERDTVTATKRNNYLIQLELVKSSAFTNNLDNSPVYMVGTVDLKFT